MTQQAYNGWTNKETWNTALWLGSDEGLYHVMLAILDDNPDNQTAAQVLKQMSEEIWPEGETPDGQALDQVDFEQIATDCREDVAP